MKSFHFHLSSGHHQRSSAALTLLAAIAGRGAGPARDLERGFDFEQKALPKLARPPKCVPRPEIGLVLGWVTTIPVMLPYVIWACLLGFGLQPRHV